ncbi:MAG: hypothetical protein WA738_19030 [Candidatus Angelobacter sp.]
MLRLDYLSCLLTIGSTILIGRRKWQGWVVAGINSAIIAVIGVRTAQTGFIPANLFCIAIYGYNILQWRSQPSLVDSPRAEMSDTLNRQASTAHVPRRSGRRLGRTATGDERFSRNSDRIRQRPLPNRR